MNEAVQLDELESGDEIEVSERETPMEVTTRERLQNGAVVVEAKNYHGRYVLRQHQDGTVSFRVGAKVVCADVEVGRYV